MTLQPSPWARPAPDLPRHSRGCRLTGTPLSSLSRLGLHLPGGTRWAWRSTSSAASGRRASPPGTTCRGAGPSWQRCCGGRRWGAWAMMASVVLPSYLLPHHLVTLAHRSRRGLALAPRGTFGKDHRYFCHHGGGATGISGWRLERPALVLRHRTGSLRRQQC